MNTKETTYAQEAIIKMIVAKVETSNNFQDNWGDYDDYGDYNDCHGDYYDAE